MRVWLNTWNLFSILTGYTPMKISQKRPPPAQRQPLPAKIKKTSTSAVPDLDSLLDAIGESGDALDTHEDMPGPGHDHAYHQSCSCDCHQVHSEKTEHQSHIQWPDRCSKKNQYEERFLKDDRTARLNTGLPNKACFNRLFAMMEGDASKMRYWEGTKKTTCSKVKRRFSSTPKKSGPKRKLPLRSEFLLTLMKLRSGCTNEFLATAFGILPSTCSSIINTWIRFLANFLRPIVYWPDKATIMASMPSYLRNKYPHLRCIIDCSETLIERPRDLKLQAATWSDYKKKNTLKYLVAITPTGMVSYISRAWGGRATDRHITQQSQFLKLIDPRDTVMADRGFPIQEDLLYRHAKLEIPPPSSGLEQMCAQNVMKTKRIANVRIHVERAINRLKWFKILDSTLQLNLLSIFNDVLIICAALCNLHGPLMSWWKHENKFSLSQTHFYCHRVYCYRILYAIWVELSGNAQKSIQIEFIQTDEMEKKWYGEWKNQM